VFEGIDNFDHWMLRVKEYCLSQRLVAVGDFGF
jgi:hypothetical protein